MRNKTGRRFLILSRQAAAHTAPSIPPFYFCRTDSAFGAGVAAKDNACRHALVAGGVEGGIVRVAGGVVGWAAVVACAFLDCIANL